VAWAIFPTYRTAEPARPRLDIYLDRCSNYAVPRKPGYATVAILKALANGHRHGFDIIDATSLPGGTVYPALGKLEADGFVQSSWEDPRIAQAEGRPPRRYYELRKAGEKLLEDALRAYRALDAPPLGRARVPRPKRA